MEMAGVEAAGVEAAGVEMAGIAMAMAMAMMAMAGMGMAAGDSMRRRAILFGVSGAVLITAGVTVYYLGKRAERRPLRLTVSAGGDGGAVLLGGRF